jgi:hypothetical protein
MTPTLAAALAAAAVRIHAALAALGDRPSCFRGYTNHIAAVALAGTILREIPAIASAATDPGAGLLPWASVRTRYATDSGALVEAHLTITQPRTAAPGFSISIPIAADVGAAGILAAWNSAIHAAWADEIAAHRARLSALTGLLVVPADPVTPHGARMKTSTILADIAEASRKAADIARDLGPQPDPMPAPRTQARFDRDAAVKAAHGQIAALAFVRDGFAVSFDLVTSLIDPPRVAADLDITSDGDGLPFSTGLGCPATEENIADFINRAIENVMADHRREFERTMSATRAKIIRRP